MFRMLLSVFMLFCIGAEKMSLTLLGDCYVMLCLNTEVEMVMLLNGSP